MNFKIHHYVICFQPRFNTYFHQLKSFQTEDNPVFFISSKLVKEIKPQGQFIKRLSTKEVMHKHNDEIYIFGIQDDYIIYGIKKIDASHYEISIRETLEHKDEIEYVLSLRIFSHIVSSDFHLILHASAINFQQQGILFVGSSKVGKTTLAKRIIAHHESTFFINDDKPLITYQEDTFYVHGTPWAGDEGLCRNTFSKISAIIFLEQGIYSKMKEMTNYDKVIYLIEHSYHLFTETYIDAYLKIINQLIDQVPIYKMIVSNDHQAYDVFYQWNKKNQIYHKAT